MRRRPFDKNLHKMRHKLVQAVEPREMDKKLRCDTDAPSPISLILPTE